MNIFFNRIFLVCSLLVITNVQGQNMASLDWVGCIGSKSIQSDEGKSIAVDDQGNIYTTGYFSDTADFDPGPGTYTMVASSRAGDAFILKLDASGNFQWAIQYGNPGCSSCAGRGIETDKYGNVYVIGYFCGLVDFDPGPGNFTMDASVGSNFLLKLDASGGFISAKQLNCNINHLALNSQGNIYLTGSFSGLVDFDPGPGVSYQFANGRSAFMLRLNSNGDLVWAKNVECTFTAIQGDKIVSDDQGNVYTIGVFGDSADFDPGPGAYKFFAPFGRCCGFKNIFIQKLDSSGVFVWARNLYSFASHQATGIAVDPAGNVYTTGIFSVTTDFDPGPKEKWVQSDGLTNSFVLKLNALGNLVWVRKVGGNLLTQTNDLTIDSAGIYITGLHRGTSFYNNSQMEVSSTLESSSDIFLAKLDTAGNLDWMRTMGGRSSDIPGLGGPANAGMSIRVDKLGNIYSTGRFKDTADFDPGPGRAERISRGYFDIFVYKMKQHACVSRGSVLTASACGSFEYGGQIYTQSGIYTQLIRNVDGCDSLITLDLTIVSIDTGVIQDGVILTSKATGADYQWLDCNSGMTVIPGAVGQQFIATSDGRYAVSLMQNGCYDTSRCIKIMTTGIGDMALPDIIRIYPNPAQEHVMVQSARPLREARIRIVNSLGGTMNDIRSLNDAFVSLDISTYSPGLYIIEITEKENTARMKLVKK